MSVQNVLNNNEKYNEKRFGAVKKWRMLKKNEDRIRLKTVLVGGANTGKTNALKRYCLNRFDPNPQYLTTISIDYKIKCTNINGLDYKVLIWDTVGQERFRNFLSIDI